MMSIAFDFFSYREDFLSRRLFFEFFFFSAESSSYCFYQLNMPIFFRSYDSKSCFVSARFLLPLASMVSALSSCSNSLSSRNLFRFLISNLLMHFDSSIDFKCKFRRQIYVSLMACLFLGLTGLAELSSSGIGGGPRSFVLSRYSSYMSSTTS